MTVAAPIFVLGSGRCGSTLVHQALASHPLARSVSTVEDRLRGRAPSLAVSRLATRAPLALRTSSRWRLGPSEGYQVLSREVSPMLVAPFRDLLASDCEPWLGRRLRAFVERRSSTDRPLVHKFTGWPRLGLLHAAFPEARFVHVVRDGRAVVSSWLQTAWWGGFRGPWNWQWGLLDQRDAKEWDASGQSFAALAAGGWRSMLDAFDDATARAPAAHWLEIRYEDLLDDPAEVLGTLVEFARLPPDPAVVAFAARRQLRRDRLDAFRSELAIETLDLLGGLLGAHLAARGYAT